ncbi:hypothetical protein Taro_040868 [Colocasia esculenta]|uniref:Uncharacterized protein n=1 Tax=Colocasia esculenta TaxID=4460 RepID=A0A843WN48_COLES|nr:hypothetical protein [Colocasia esculenta]
MPSGVVGGGRQADADGGGGVAVNAEDDPGGGLRSSWQLGKQEIPTPSRSSSPLCLLRPARTIILKSTKGEIVSLKTRNAYDITTAHRMGYKMIDGRVTRTLKGQEPEAEEDSEDDEDSDADSHPEPMDVQGGDEGPHAEQVPPAAPHDIRDFMDDQMARLTQHFNARFDHLNTRMDARVNESTRQATKLKCKRSEIYKKYSVVDRPKAICRQPVKTVSKQTIGRQEKSVAVDRQDASIDRSVQLVDSQRLPVDGLVHLPETWFWKPSLQQYRSTSTRHLLTVVC